MNTYEKPSKYSKSKTGKALWILICRRFYNMLTKIRYLLICCILFAPCFAEDESKDSLDFALLNAMEYYYRGNYNYAIKELQHALDTFKGGNRLPAHKFLGFCYIAVGHNLIAKEHFKKVLSINSKFKIDSLAVSPEIYRTFVEAKQERSREGAMCSCFIPGWGQFMKGEELKGKMILTAAALTAGASLYSWYITDQKRTDYHTLGLEDREKMDDAYNTYNRWHKTSLTCTALFFSVYLYSIIDALFLKPTMNINNDESNNIFLEKDYDYICVGIRISL